MLKHANRKAVSNVRDRELDQQYGLWTRAYEEAGRYRGRGQVAEADRTMRLVPNIENEIVMLGGELPMQEARV
ncbi:hypothetical protein [Saccharibacter floricola]|uniref:Uncharacterized protein n=1 Tax=Saccharibacter floricola DSM 15669 TaxID=1123227 RepID=A0ABQ0NWE1_9PROT|nr:hypothetical protein [Saccharibacter floricola]GBQ04976.1 hypothetical protein AA15669_0246 [Saccharibacter floricola DSM 15669]